MKSTLQMVAILGISILSSCSGPEAQPSPEATESSNVSQDFSSPSPVQVASLNLEKDKFYLYTDSPSDNRICSENIDRFTNPDEVRCVGEADWKSLCEASPFIMSRAALGLTGDMYFEENRNVYEGVRHLIENNGIVGQTVHWDPSEDIPASESCRITVRVEGMYNGSSIDKTLTGHARLFILQNDGKVFIDSFY
jgi:hypothetical protein